MATDRETLLRDVQAEGRELNARARRAASEVSVWASKDLQRDWAREDRSQAPLLLEIAGLRVQLAEMHARNEAEQNAKSLLQLARNCVEEIEFYEREMKRPRCTGREGDGQCRNLSTGYVPMVADQIGGWLCGACGQDIVFPHLVSQQQDDIAALLHEREVAHA